MSLPMLVWGGLALTFIVSFGFTVFEKISNLSKSHSNVDNICDDVYKGSESAANNSNNTKDSTVVNGVSYKSVA